MINFKCRKCGEGMDAPESLCGTFLRCPMCDEVNCVPHLCFFCLENNANEDALCTVCFADESVEKAIGKLGGGLGNLAYQVASGISNKSLARIEAVKIPRCQGCANAFKESREPKPVDRRIIIITIVCVLICVIVAISVTLAAYGMGWNPWTGSIFGACAIAAFVGMIVGLLIGNIVSPKCSTDEDAVNFRERVREYKGVQELIDKGYSTWDIVQ